MLARLRTVAEVSCLIGRVQVIWLSSASWGCDRPAPGAGDHREPQRARSQRGAEAACTHSSYRSGGSAVRTDLRAPGGLREPQPFRHGVGSCSRRQSSLDGNTADTLSVLCLVTPKGPGEDSPVTSSRCASSCARLVAFITPGLGPERRTSCCLALRCSPTPPAPSRLRPGSGCAPATAGASALAGSTARAPQPVGRGRGSSSEFRSERSPGSPADRSGVPGRPGVWKRECRPRCLVLRRVRARVRVRVGKERTPPPRAPSVVPSVRLGSRQRVGLPGGCCELAPVSRCRRQRRCFTDGARFRLRLFLLGRGTGPSPASAGLAEPGRGARPRLLRSLRPRPDVRAPPPGRALRASVCAGVTHTSAPAPLSPAPPEAAGSSPRAPSGGRRVRARPASSGRAAGRVCCGDFIDVFSYF